MDATVTNATFHGVSGLSGDGVSLPDLTLDATATADKSASGTIKKIHNLPVNTANGVATATLDIPLTAKNQFNLSFIQWQGANGNVAINAQITPSITTRDVVLTVPDPTVFPKKGNASNKYTFGGNNPNELDNPAWVATFIGIPDPTPYLNATTFMSFNVGASAKVAMDKTPNWYFYWSQTSATMGVHTYAGGGITALHAGLTYFSTTGDTHFNPPLNKWVALIGGTAGGGPSQIDGWNNAEGIDFFAWICRHEDRHLQDSIIFWGQHNHGYNPVTGNYDNDGDGDYLPDDKEQQLGMPNHPETNGYNKKMYATPMDHFHYGPGWSDTEDYCLHYQSSWTNGNADSQDWSNPGHQF